MHFFKDINISTLLLVLLVGHIHVLAVSYLAVMEANSSFPYISPFFIYHAPILLLLILGLQISTGRKWGPYCTFSKILIFYSTSYFGFSFLKLSMWFHISIFTILKLEVFVKFLIFGLSINPEGAFVNFTILNLRCFFFGPALDARGGGGRGLWRAGGLRCFRFISLLAVKFILLVYYVRTCSSIWVHSSNLP